MKVTIKRIDASLPLPEYHTSGSVAFDLISRESVVIEPKSIALIPGNVIIATPPGYMLVVVPRSSTPKKKGLSIPHGIGIIDQDYCGENDEIKLQVFNFTDTPVTVEKGERLCQAAFVKVERAEWEETQTAHSTSRGGFGSTDKQK